MYYSYGVQTIKIRVKNSLNIPKG